MEKVNYHTHTYRCGHAQGNEEDMVKSAIEMDIKKLGFSEHVPFPNYRKHLIKSVPSIRNVQSVVAMVYAFIRNGPGMRMPYKQKNDYYKNILDCKEKYKDQIEIYKGYEAEGLSEYFEYYQYLLYSHEVDYLILGHHFNKHCVHNAYYGKPKLSKKEMYQYCNDVEKALETKLFSYLAHPDLFMIGYKDIDLDMKTVSRRICEKAKALHIPLELNAGGMRRGLVERKGKMGYLYPNKTFWKIVSEVGNDVILGFDAHDPSDFNNGMYNQMLDFANEYKLHVIDEFEFLEGHR